MKYNSHYYDIILFIVSIIFDSLLSLIFFRADFYDIFPGCNSDAIDFLLKTLKFNPRHRITVDSAIEHLFLTKVRDKSKETIAKGKYFYKQNIKTTTKIFY